MALLNNLIDFNPIVDALWTKFEPKIDEQLDKLREQVVALMPMIGAAAGKAIMDKLREVDPDLPIISDIFDLSEKITGNINDDPRIPIHIPFIGDLDLGNLFGRR
jgi:hypothetical protein